MDKHEVQRKIDRNRVLIDKALSIEDTQVMYSIVRDLAKSNEKLLQKLQ